MLNDHDKSIIKMVVDAYPPAEVAFQLLLSFKHRIQPEVYIHAGYLIAEKTLSKPKQISILNFNN